MSEIKNEQANDFEILHQLFNLLKRGGIKKNWRWYDALFQNVRFS